MTKKIWTPEEKKAFGEKMRALKEAKKNAEVVVGMIGENKPIEIPTVEEKVEEAVKKEADSQDQAISEVLVNGTQVPVVEETKPIEEVTVETPAPVEPVAPVETDKVVFRSADNRELEVSINDLNFKGKEITVPAEMVISIRRNLIEGGFFLKD